MNEPTMREIMDSFSGDFSSCGLEDLQHCLLNRMKELNEVVREMEKYRDDEQNLGFWASYLDTARKRDQLDKPYVDDDVDPPASVKENT